MESHRVSSSAYFCKFQQTHCPPAVPTNLLPTPILSKQRTGKTKILQSTDCRQAPLCQSQIPYYCRDFMFICSTLGHITPSFLHVIQYSGDHFLNLPSFFQVSAPHCADEFTTWLHASNSIKRQTALYLQVKVLLLCEHLSPSCYPLKKYLKRTLLDSSSSSCRVNQVPRHL